MWLSIPTDPIVGTMALWFLGQIISRENAFEGDDDSKETFEKLLHVANITWPVILLTMAVNYPLDGIAEIRRERNSDGEETGYGTV
ncbi:hypothetical protein DVH05_006758 [Phytophthora capsici]|nr:hypothetical protein DVH05_006758 [Phytophthora capsici]